MAAPHYFRLAALPVLDPPPAAPPMTLRELYLDVPAGRPQRLVRAVLLADDLLQREAVRSGEVERSDPAVLTDDQVRGEAPLPAELELTFDPPGAPAFPMDVLWTAYYRFAAALADAERSRFLAEWVGWEVALRNVLAVARARALGVEPGRYTVAWDLQQYEGEAEAAQEAWSAAPDPLTGLRTLMTAQWRWIDQREPWFTFDDDEFAAYAAKLVLLYRWQRSAGGETGRERAVVEEVGA